MPPNIFSKELATEEDDALGQELQVRDCVLLVLLFYYSQLAQNNGDDNDSDEETSRWLHLTSKAVNQKQYHPFLFS